MSEQTSQFLTVPDTVKKFPVFTKGGLRWLLFNREQNGFNRCVVRIGRRVLIDEVELVAWLRDQRETRAAA